jgi:hypothetical protein
VFEIANRGLDTLRTVKVNYTLNGGAVVTQIRNNLSVPRGGVFNDTFPSLQLNSPGNYVLKAYTSEPNNAADLYLPNDTLSFTFTVFDPVTGPVKEGFEGTAFPPVNWSAVRSNPTFSWERNTRGSAAGAASAWMRNKVLNTNGAKDELYSPLIQISNADSVFVTFDVAHVAARYPGSTHINLDSLEVFFTKDCGKTLTSVYKKWGEDLQTTGPNFPIVYSATDSIGFVPQNNTQWRKDSINISNLAGANGTFQIVFRNSNNFGNNTFLDNININTITLPAKLKKNGYLILPNPSRGMVYVQHYLPPVDLRGIVIVNAAGQTIWQQEFSGGASSLIPVNLLNQAAGVYTLRLRYNNKVISQRIVKLE